MDDLLAEKKLLDVFKKSLRLPRSKFNLFSTVLAIVLLTIHVSYSTQSRLDLHNAVRAAAANGFSLSLGLLGFLIAGLTILSSVSSSGLVVHMANTEYKNSGISYLKYNYFGLVSVFIWYLIFAFCCMAITVFGAQGSALSAIINALGCDSWTPLAKDFLAKGAFILIYSFQFYLLLQLKSFVFNVYHISMTSARWMQEQDAKKNLTR
jgi:hypothetical protein